MTKAIKNVSDETWREFKAMASLKNMSMGEYFEELVKNATIDKSENRRAWDEILSMADNPIINDKTAKIMKKRASEIRKGFRIREYEFDI